MKVQNLSSEAYKCRHIEKARTTWLAMRELWKTSIRIGKKTEKRKKEVQIMSSHPHGPFCEPMPTSSWRAGEQSLHPSQPWGATKVPSPQSLTPPTTSHRRAGPPSERIPGTVSWMPHDCSDLHPLCPGKALDEPGLHSCRWNPLRSVIKYSLRAHPAGLCTHRVRPRDSVVQPAGSIQKEQKALWAQQDWSSSPGPATSESWMWGRACLSPGVLLVECEDRGPCRSSPASLGGGVASRRPTLWVGGNLHPPSPHLREGVRLHTGSRAGREGPGGPWFCLGMKRGTAVSPTCRERDHQHAGCPWCLGWGLRLDHQHLPPPPL